MEKTIPEPPITLKVTEGYHIARARMTAMSKAREAGFSWTAAGLLATSVSELAWNLVLHATRGGKITIAVLERNHRLCLEVTSEDDGPGIPDLDQATEDGYTTSKGLGSGLAGVKRMMDDFEITSVVGQGTQIMARIWQPCK